MWWFPNGAKRGDQYRAGADQDRAEQGKSSKGFTKDHGSENGIENETGLSCDRESAEEK